MLGDGPNEFVCPGDPFGEPADPKGIPPRTQYQGEDQPTEEPEAPVNKEEGTKMRDETKGTIKTFALVLGSVIIALVLYDWFSTHTFKVQSPVVANQAAPASPAPAAPTPAPAAPAAPAPVVPTPAVPAPVAAPAQQSDEVAKLQKELAKERARTAKAEADARRAQAESRMVVMAQPAPTMKSENYQMAGTVTVTSPAPVAAPANVPQAAVPTAPVSVPEAKCDGQDVLVYDTLVKHVPGFNPNQAVLAAWDKNGWFVNGPAWATPDIVRASTMTREGDWWRARGLCGVRFHPVQLDGEGRPKWAKIEEVYPLTAPTVNMLTNSPCLLAKF